MSRFSHPFSHDWEAQASMRVKGWRSRSIPRSRSRKRTRTAGAFAVVVVIASTLLTAPSGVRPASAADVFTDGFESGDLSNWTSSSNVVVQTQQVFAGTFAARTTSSTAWASRTLAAPRSQLSMTYRAYFDTRSSAVILHRLSPSSGPWSIQLQVNDKGKLAYRNNVTKQTRVGGTTLATDRWYEIEMRVTVAGSSSAVDVLLDGAVVSGLSHTEDLGSSPIAKVEIGNRPSNRTYDLAFDDVAVTDDGGGGGGADCPPDWAMVATPSTLRALTGVSSIAGNDAWAVGFLKGQQSAPTAVRWNGSSWSSVAVPGVGNVRSAFNAVDAISSTDAWAVGYSWEGGGEGSGQAYRTITQRWNGSAWKIVASPNVGAGSNDLVDVDARTSSDAWAVGYRLNGNVKETLALRWNGSAWNVVPTPSPGSASNGLTAVAATSADDAWAVGYRSDGTGYSPLALRWDGTSWVEQDVTALGLGDETILTGVVVPAPGDVWVVGYANLASGYEGVTGHLEAGAWRRVDPADPGGSVVVPQDVTATADGDIWWAGVRHGDAANSEATIVERYSNGAWQIVPTPNASPHDNALYAIDATPGGQRVWAVGRAANDAIALTGCLEAGAAPVVAASGPGGLGAPGSAAAGSALHLLEADGAAAPTAAAIDVVAADVAGAAGLRVIAHTFPPTVFDFDGDEWPDVFLNHHYEAGTTLYRNRGDGTFEAARSFPKLDRHGCDAGDVDGDRDADLYCTTGANFGTDAKANELWIQENGDWVDRAATFRALDPFGRGRRAVFLDVNLDGDLDLYVGNLRERGDGLPSPNRLLLGTGSAFEPAQRYGVDAELRSGCARTGDFSGDGYPDLLVCTNAGPKLYRNDSGTGFDDVTPTLAPNLKGSDGVLADVDGDTRLDLVMVDAGAVRIWLQTAAGSFVKRADLAQSGAKAVAAGDVNLDGLPDLYVVRAGAGGSSNAPDVVLLNAGDGIAYTSMTVPGSPGGQADSVEVIDHDRNGQADFLVMNGNGLHNQAGYTQLIAFFPA